MPRSLHFDLRCRVLSPIIEGLFCHEAAARFDVSASSCESARCIDPSLGMFVSRPGGFGPGP